MSQAGALGPCLVMWERMLSWRAPAQAEVARRWGSRVSLGFTWGFRHRSAGNTELDEGEGVTNPE